MPPRRASTILTHAGRCPEAFQGAVNIPPFRASTILFDSWEAMEDTGNYPLSGIRYGRVGNPSSQAFEEVLTGLSGYPHAVSTGSGVSAITTALSAFLTQGDRVLIADNVYGPTRLYAEKVLRRIGINIVYFDPLNHDDVRQKLTQPTKIFFMESPGSITFEITDIPALATMAKEQGAITMLDNTWATPLYFRAFDHGIDIDIHAGTKYIVGHADANLGVCLCRDGVFEAVKKQAYWTGQAAGADDLYLGLRGLRTLAARLPIHGATGLRLADWFSQQPETIAIIHPARPDHPQHALWQRDFSGTTGLFSVLLTPLAKNRLSTLLNSLKLFDMGYSWGGYESLMIPQDPRSLRTVQPWQKTGLLLRIHAGLESPDDLIDDLENGFSALRQSI
jgi:cystathionine beta-lyase